MPCLCKIVDAVDREDPLSYGQLGGILGGRLHITHCAITKRLDQVISGLTPTSGLEGSASVSWHLNWVESVMLRIEQMSLLNL